MLEIKNVTKTFGNLTVLRGLSLSCAPGDIVILAGQNGAGKSTLLRIIAGLARPDNGEVVRPGTSLGLFSHHLFLYNRLSVRENLTLFASAQGKSDINGVLAEFDLNGVASRYVGELSKGLQARVGLARTFLAEPKVVCLDEPTSNLDEKGTAILLAALERTRRDSQETSIVLLATHDLHRLARIANRAVVLHDGRIFADSRGGESKNSVEDVLQCYREVNR